MCTVTAASVHVCKQCCHNCWRLPGHQHVQNEASSCLHQRLCHQRKHNTWVVWPVQYLYPFLPQGIVHPIVALIIWSDIPQSISPYRFCVGMLSDYNCTIAAPSFLRSMYVLDFAGSGAVHMLGEFSHCPYLTSIIMA